MLMKVWARSTAKVRKSHRVEKSCNVYSLNSASTRSSTATLKFARSPCMITIIIMDLRYYGSPTFPGADDGIRSIFGEWRDGFSFPGRKNSLVTVSNSYPDWIRVREKNNLCREGSHRNLRVRIQNSGIQADHGTAWDNSQRHDFRRASDANESRQQ